MDQVVLFISLGFTVGAVYAVIASSLVVVHSATGVLNFAQGAIALWGVWVAAELAKSGTLILPVGEVAVSDGPAPTPLVIALGTLSATALALLLHLLVLRPLRSAPPLSQVAASVGVMLLVISLVPLRFETQTTFAVSVLEVDSVEILGAQVATGDLTMLALAVAIALLLAAYLRFTRWGTATRASAENETAVMLTGYSPQRLAAVVWCATGAATGLVAIVGSGSIGLDPIGYAFYVLPGLAAALIAKLRSVLVACLAGLVIGCFQSLLLMMATYDWWPSWAQGGFGETLPFLIVVVALWINGKSLPTRGGVVVTTMPPVRVPSMRPVPTAATLLVVLAAIVLTEGSWRFGVVTSIIMSLIALSLVVLTGYLGQISLGAMAFAGTGGFLLSRATTQWGLPFPVDMVVPVLCATVLGIVVGLPALRIRGAHLAVVTLAGALAIQAFVFGNPAFTPFEGNLVQDPSLFGIDLGVRDGTTLTTIPFSLMVLTVVGLLTWATARLLSGQTGRAFLAVRSNERAASSAGIDVASTKLLGFALSAALAGVGGCLIGYSRSQVSVESFNVLVGLAILCTVYVAGITSLSGAILAGVLAPLGVAEVFLEHQLGLGTYYNLIAAIGLVVTAVLNPIGITGGVRQSVEHLRERRAAGRPDVQPDVEPDVPPAVDLPERKVAGQHG